MFDALRRYRYKIINLYSKQFFKSALSFMLVSCGNNFLQFGVERYGRRFVSRGVKSFAKFPPGALLSLDTVRLEGII
jgi:hypothetical protein